MLDIESTSSLFIFHSLLTQLLHLFYQFHITHIKILATMDFHLVWLGSVKVASPSSQNVKISVGCKRGVICPAYRTTSAISAVIDVPCESYIKHKVNTK